MVSSVDGEEGWGQGCSPLKITVNFSILISPLSPPTGPRPVPSPLLSLPGSPPGIGFPASGLAPTHIPSTTVFPSHGSAHVATQGLSTHPPHILNVSSRRGMALPLEGAFCFGSVAGPGSSSPLFFSILPELGWASSIFLGTPSPLAASTGVCRITPDYSAASAGYLKASFWNFPKGIM